MSIHHFPILRAALTYFTQRLTPAGRSFFIIWFVAALQGSVSLDIPIYHIWSFTTVCLAVAWLSSFFAVPNLQLTRRHLPPVVAGTSLVYDVQLHNRSQRAAYALRVTEMELPVGMRFEPDTDATIVPRLAPHSDRVLTLRLHCAKRGHYKLPGLYAASSYPLGLCRGFSFHLQEAYATVYPAHAIPATFHLPFNPSVAIASPSQVTSLAAGNEETDVAFVREYRHGDNPRHLHWASWARLGMPAIKIFHQQQEAGPHVGLVLDTAIPSARETEALESGISAVAGIATYLSHQRIGFDFFMAENAIYRFSDGPPNNVDVTPLMNMLAGLQPGQPVDWPEAATRIFAETPTCNALVFIALDWSTATANFVARLQAHGIGVRTIVIRRGPTSQPLPPASVEDLVRLHPGNPWPQEIGTASPLPWNGP